MSRLVVLGAGESGVGAAVLGKAKGWNVFVSDKGKVKEKYKEVLWNHGIEWEEEKHTEELILNADEVVKSPGIPEKAEMLKKVRAKGIPVVSEIEFALRYTKAKTIGITGTNGKTTTTMLTYYILEKAGLNVMLGGNVGKSLALQLAEREPEYIVLELSSFQLDDMFEAHINYAILLNITPDHLDRYATMDEYIKSKFRITQNQTGDDAFIYCSDDEVIMEELNKRQMAMRLCPFSTKTSQGQTAWLQNEEIIIDNHNNQFTMSIYELALQGRHNVYNSMAAGVVSKLLDIRKDLIRECLSDYKNVDHRLEAVGKVCGIEFINDSKATNLNAAWYALESMTGPTIWIVGGIDKGNDYNMVKDLVREKVKAIVCLGVDNQKIHDAFSGIVDTIVDTRSAEEAVKAAYYMGRKGDTVLLSPACASFDLFENYEDRGRQFKSAVRSL